jgi:hypothetical protein
MATIVQLRDHRSPVATRDSGQMAGWGVVSLLIALAVVLGAPVVGFIVAGLFGTGMVLTRLGQRQLRQGEFVVISALHVAAVLLLSL